MAQRPLKPLPQWLKVQKGQTNKLRSVECRSIESHATEGKRQISIHPPPMLNPLSHKPRSESPVLASKRRVQCQWLKALHVPFAAALLLESKAVKFSEAMDATDAQRKRNKLAHLSKSNPKNCCIFADCWLTCLLAMDQTDQTHSKACAKPENLSGKDSLQAFAIQHGPTYHPDLSGTIPLPNSSTTKYYSLYRPKLSTFCESILNSRKPKSEGK